MINVPLPGYISETTEEIARRKAETQFRLRLAALFLSKNGTLMQLAKTCGLHEKSLSALTDISPELAIKIEKALGRDLFPREYFRPDLFVVES
jgi:hypothetical protein